MATVRTAPTSMNFVDRELPDETVGQLNEAYNTAKNLKSFDGTIVFHTYGFDNDWVECRVGRNFVTVGGVKIVLGIWNVLDPEIPDTYQ